MAVDEQYLRVRRTLEEKLGVEEASYLLDRPVGGSSELVTNHTLDLKLATIDARFAAVDARFDSIEKRIEALDRRLESIDQKLAGLSWQLVAAVIAGMGVMGGLFAVLVLVAGN